VHPPKVIGVSPKVIYLLLLAGSELRRIPKRGCVRKLL
jgi:hypothetical protein